ncbi:capsid protein, partial [Clostridioides difficile]|nr:capsid protein [Clostridioides difficile]MBY2594461.1 capsid protein [Clostridioides difficile]MBY2719536.1 capsid protein [Clostridioides difficile]MBY2749449.1 capsid protein [Clostridioides difficile]MBZ0607996.1 capsid protein [Clostridioides difficile]
KAGAGAKQIFMSLIHPSAIITPVSYQFSTLDEPRAVTEGKYLYFEESFEDVFILNKKADAIQFVVEGDGA